jgi:hypothetical protein
LFVVKDERYFMIGKSDRNLGWNKGSINSNKKAVEGAGRQDIQKDTFSSV